jgi:hypothetical protein
LVSTNKKDSRNKKTKKSFSNCHHKPPIKTKNTLTSSTCLTDRLLAHGPSRLSPILILPRSAHPSPTRFACPPRMACFACCPGPLP